jgi:hypothetical protein
MHGKGKSGFSMLIRILAMLLSRKLVIREYSAFELFDISDVKGTPREFTCEVLGYGR